MKTIKKNWKLILCFVLFALLSIIFAFSPLMTTFSVDAAEQKDVAATAFNYLFSTAHHLQTKAVDADSEKLIVPLLNATENVFKSSSITKYKVLVTDPAGYEHSCTVDLATSTVSGADTKDELKADDYFTYYKTEDSAAKIPANSLVVKYLNSGRYNIVYVVEDTTNSKTYYSNKYSVDVTKSNYELEFVRRDEGKENLKWLLPPTTVVDANKTFDLPIASVKHVGDSEELDTVKPRVTINGYPLDSTTESVYDEANNTITPKYAGLYKFEYVYENGNRPTKSFEMRVYASTDEYNPVGENDVELVTPDLTNIGAELGKTGIALPAVTEVVKNNRSVYVDLNILEIDIVKQDNPDIKLKEKLTNNNLTFDMTLDAFSATSYDDMIGTYDIVYKTEDAYGYKKEIKVSLRNVKDNTNPTVYMAYNYELTEAGLLSGSVNTDYASDLKATYYKDSLYFPAIYATDLTTNLNEFDFVRYFVDNNNGDVYYIDNIGYDDENKTILTEEQLLERNSSAARYFNKYEGEDSGIGKFNKVVKFQFDETQKNNLKSGRTFTLHYIAITKNKKDVQIGQLYETGTDEYEFKIYDNPSETEKGKEDPAKVEIKEVVEDDGVNLDEKFNLSYTATDEKYAADRLKTQLFYIYPSTTLTKETKATYYENLFKKIQAAFSTTLNNNEISYVTTYTQNILDTQTLLTNFSEDETVADIVKGSTLYRINNTSKATNKFQFEFEGKKESGQVVLIAITLNDFYKLSYDAVTLSINNTTENNAPTVATITYDDTFWTKTGSETVESLTSKETSYPQSSSVTLPKITFADDDKTLILDVKYYIDTPFTESGFNYLIPRDSEVELNTKDYEALTINGGTIFTSKVGTYYVVYTATDDAGNQTNVFLTFKVHDISSPILSVALQDEAGEDLKDKISGNTITVEVGSIIKFVPKIEDSEGNDITNNGATYKVKVEKNNFDCTSAGGFLEYKFNQATTDSEIKFIFTAKYDPANEGQLEDVKEWHVVVTEPKLTWDEGAFTIKTNADENSFVTLPYLIATYGEETARAVPTVTDPSGSEIKVKNIPFGDTSAWQFKTSSKGTYTVTYTAKIGSYTDTKTYKIKVGDNIGPTLTLKGDSESKLKSDLVYDGTSIDLVIEVKTESGKRKLNVSIYKGSYEDGNKIGGVEDILSIKDLDKVGGQTYEDSADLWNNLTFELKSSSNNFSEKESKTNRKVYTITGAGEYTISLLTHDQYNNDSDVKEIKFNVKLNSTQANTINDTTVGIILIVVSLVVLAGVILFFTFTGKKGGKTKNKTNKKTKSNTKEIAEETQSSEEAKSSDDDAKSGDVE